jgi:catechol 2,3-dioxygenase-like lactoylglutathione lyase family enzyme
MLNGAHVLLYSRDAEADRAFVRDTLGFTGVDTGGGWLIFKLPPAEVAVHPTEEQPRHELYLMCDDLQRTLDELRAKGVEASRPVSDEGWGLLTSIRLPSGADLPIYEPRHELAHQSGAALYRRWLEELWAGDLEVAEEIVTPDFVGHWPDQDVHGPMGAAEAVRAGRAPFDDIRLSLDVGPVADGDKVAARWTFHGAYLGGLPGATAPAGTRVAFSGMDVLRIDPATGKFAEYWVVSDALGLMTQLGTTP